MEEFLYFGCAALIVALIVAVVLAYRKMSNDYRKDKEE